MLGLTSLEVYNSLFNINHENNKIELYKDTFDEFSFAEMKNELEAIVNLPGITPEDLEGDMLFPRFVQA